MESFLSVKRKKQKTKQKIKRHPFAQLLRQSNSAHTIHISHYDGLEKWKYDQNFDLFYLLIVVYISYVKKYEAYIQNSEAKSQRIKYLCFLSSSSLPATSTRNTCSSPGKNQDPNADIQGRLASST